MREIIRLHPMDAKRLTVWVSRHCPSCPEALVIANRLRHRYPSIEVKTLDVEEQPPDDEVFAVPTYILDGRVVFLGNPTDEQVDNLLSASADAIP